MMREISYEKEVEADAEVVEILFSRALRALPLNGIQRIQTRLKIPIKSQTQRMMLTKIHNDSNALWGGY